MFVLAVGNPFDGLVLEGPFDTVDEAVAYAEEFKFTDDEWHVVEVEERDD